MREIARHLLMSLAFLFCNCQDIIAEIPYVIYLNQPFNNQTYVYPNNIMLAWQVQGYYNNSQYPLTYVIRVAKVDQNVEINNIYLEDYCNSCISGCLCQTVIETDISYESSYETYFFNGEACSTYAWQVLLIENIPGYTPLESDPVGPGQHIIGRSEVQIFSATCDPYWENSSQPVVYMTFPKTVNNYTYEINRKMEDGKVIIPFKYESFYTQNTAETKASVTVYDKQWISKGTTQIEFSKGLNYISYPCSANLRNYETYYLEVVDAKGNKKYLKFKVR